jgi:hypothetical protein
MSRKLTSAVGHWGQPWDVRRHQAPVGDVRWAGWVVAERAQLVRTHAGAVARARQALDDLERTWRGRVDRMSALLAEGTEPERKNSPIRETG